MPVKKGGGGGGRFEVCIMVVLTLGEEEILLRSGGKRRGMREYHRTWLSEVHDYLHLRNLSISYSPEKDQLFLPMKTGSQR